jgi:3'(2'), 5'-bisphosphate nucleotidase
MLVGDFAAQAVVNTILARAFPDDAIVGEEDAKDLRAASADKLRGDVVKLARDALNEPRGPGDVEQWGIGTGRDWTETELLEAIDRGTAEGGRTGRAYTLSSGALSSR